MMHRQHIRSRRCARHHHDHHRCSFNNRPWRGIHFHGSFHLCAITFLLVGNILSSSTSSKSFVTAQQQQQQQHDIHNGSIKEKNGWGDHNKKTKQVDNDDKQYNTDTNTDTLTINQVLSIAEETLSNLFFQSDHGEATGIEYEQQQQQQQQQLRSSINDSSGSSSTRRAMMYLPPPPVTPFRGGIKSVPQSVDDDGNESVPTSIDDDDVDDENNDTTDGNTAIEYSEEANNTSDRHHHQENIKNPGVNNFVSPRIKRISKNSSKTSSSSSSSWAPEDYPDPWTNPMLCGGAATASLMDNNDNGDDAYITNLNIEKTSQQQSQLMKRPPLLFCDPDQVLDKETLHNVAMQLRSFAERFAFDSDFYDDSVNVEGGDFDSGGSSNDYAKEEEEEGTIGENNNSESNRDDQADDMISPQVVVHWGADVDVTTEPSPLDNSSPPNNAEEEEEDKTSEQQHRRHLRSAFSDNATIERKMYSDSVGGLFSTTTNPKKENASRKQRELVNDQKVEVAIALVQRINLPAILRADSYFFYSDQDDMVNDAAQYFARYIHDTWSKHLTEEINASSSEGNYNNNGTPARTTPTSIVLIFISTLDRICYISSGTRIAAVLPWWRLEHVVQDMKQDLRRGQTGDALNVAIEELTEMLLDGPPTFGDRVNDFFQRFGIVMLFTIFTFVFATWGECRDQRKGLFFAERRSRMTAAEKEKARSLQKEFCTKTCPICLEPFDLTPSKDTDDDDRDLTNEGKCTVMQKPKIKRVDSFGIPLVGSDNQPIKMLRCGHIFDNTCWSMWADSGHGNPMICPVCRQDVGRPKRGESTATTAATQWNNNNAEEGGSDGDNSIGRSESPTNQEQQQQRSSLFTRIVANATAGPSGLANYNSTAPVQQLHGAGAQRGSGAPFMPLSHPTFRRLRVPTFAGFGLPTIAVVPAASMADGVVDEQTPLFAQTSSGNEEEDDDYW